MSNAPGNRVARTPSPLTSADAIAVVAPAGPATREQLETGLDYLEARFEVELHGNPFEQTGYFAGSDEDRLEALRSALSSTAAKALIATRGGFGTSKLIDQVELDSLMEKPKWIIGSSDLTCLHIKIWHEARLQSIHGPMVIGLGKKTSDDRLLEQILETGTWMPPSKLRGHTDGQGQGPFVGGNLTMLAHLAGSLDPSFLRESVLFLEDIGERPYRLERALVQLKRAGFLDALAGIVLGEFTGCDSGRDGTTAEAALLNILRPLGIPIAAGYPAAHGERNHPFIHGSQVELRIAEGRVSFSTCPP